MPTVYSSAPAPAPVPNLVPAPAHAAAPAPAPGPVSSWRVPTVIEHGDPKNWNRNVIAKPVHPCRSRSNARPTIKFNERDFLCALAVHLVNFLLIVYSYG